MKLKNNFTRMGCEFTQVMRDGDLAIYERSNGEYEVIKVKRAYADNDLTGIKKGDELYPSTSDWGSYGWTKTSLSDAFAKVSELKKKK